MVNSNNFNTIE